MARVPAQLGARERGAGAGARVSTDRDDDGGDYARLAAALAESEERYRAVVGNLDEGITLHDAEGRILTANPSAARILGMSPATLVGQTLTGPAWACIDSTGAPLPDAQHPLTIAL